MAETFAELAVRIIADAKPMSAVLGTAEKEIMDFAVAAERAANIATVAIHEFAEKSAKEIDKWIKDNPLEKANAKAAAAAKKAANEMTKHWKDMGKAQLAIGAAITVAMGKMIESFTETGSELKNLSIATGITVEHLAGLKYAAEQNGTTLKVVTTAIKRMSNSVIELDKGSAKATDGFARLGLSIADVRGLNPDQLFIKVAAGLSQMGSQTEKIGVLTELFGVIGQSALQLVPLLSMSADELQAMIDKGAKASGWTEVMATLARDLGREFNTLATATGGLVNEFVSAFAPVLKDAIKIISGVVGWVRDWIKENPDLSKTLGVVAIAIGGVATAIGTLTLAQWALNKAMVANPIGLIVTAFVALVAWGVFLAMNLDLLRGKWGMLIASIVPLIGLPMYIIANWDRLKQSWLLACLAMTDALIALIGWIPGIGDALRRGHDEIVNILNEDAWRQEDERVKNLTKVITDEFAKQKKEITDKYALLRSQAEATYKNAVDKINEEYGYTKEKEKGKIELAKEATKTLKEGYKERISAAKDACDIEIGLLDKAYDHATMLLDKRTSDALDGIQRQIDAIDEQTAVEELALTRAAEKQNEAELVAAVDSATTDEDVTKAKQKLADYRVEITRKELLRKRDADKDALRDEKDRIRAAAQSEKDRLKTELDANIANQKGIYDEIHDTNERLSTEADNKLVETLARLDNERLEAIRVEGEKYRVAWETLVNKERDDILFKANELVRTNEQIAKINVAYDALTKRYVIDIVTRQTTVSGGGGGGTTTGTTTGGYGAGGRPPEVQPGVVTDFSAAEGGIVTRPSVALVGEAGPEAIIPLNEAGAMGGLTINFTQPVFFDREDTMNKFVDMIRKGIQRQDRLRYGGAYSG